MVKAITTEIFRGEVLSSYVSAPYSFDEAQAILNNQYKSRRKTRGAKVSKSNRVLTAHYSTGFIVTVQLVHA